MLSDSLYAKKRMIGNRNVNRIGFTDGLPAFFRDCNIGRPRCHGHIGSQYVSDPFKGFQHDKKLDTYRLWRTVL
jgi:hypothetical protein